MKPVNLADAFASFTEHWSPRVAAELNGQQVRVAKLLGEFEWHFHAGEDELFLVHKGELRIQFRERVGERASQREVRLGPGEFVVVPRGVEHRPVADSEVEVVLFEPASTRHTGNIRCERTVDEFETLA